MFRHRSFLYNFAIDKNKSKKSALQSEILNYFKTIVSSLSFLFLPIKLCSLIPSGFKMSTLLTLEVKYA